MLAILAHDPDSGMLDYGRSAVMHKDESNVVLEYLDCYRSHQHDHDDLTFFVFDRTFPHDEHLGQ